MIEFNLLPDIKLTFIKTRRTKRLVTTVAFVVGAVSVVAFVFLLGYVNVVQKSRIHSLNNQINNSKSQLTNNTDLNKILTIQKQLQALPNIESRLPTTSRLYAYLSQLVPSTVTISALQASFTADTLIITGNANDLITVNQFIDTLKFSTFSDAHDKNVDAFSNVVLNSFGLGSGTGQAALASYNVTTSFDPKLFDPTDTVQLTVPSITTTRSIVNQPTDLFKANPTKPSGS